MAGGVLQIKVRVLDHSGSGGIRFQRRHFDTLRVVVIYIFVALTEVGSISGKLAALLIVFIFVIFAIVRQFLFIFIGKIVAVFAFHNVRSAALFTRTLVAVFLKLLLQRLLFTGFFCAPERGQCYFGQFDILENMNIIEKQGKINQQKADNEGPQHAGRLIYNQAQETAEGARRDIGETQKIFPSRELVEAKQQRGEQEDEERPEELPNEVPYTARDEIGDGEVKDEQKGNDDGAAHRPQQRGRDARAAVARPRRVERGDYIEGKEHNDQVSDLYRRFYIRERLRQPLF